MKTANSSSQPKSMDIMQFYDLCPVMWLLLYSVKLRLVLMSLPKYVVLLNLIFLPSFIFDKYSIIPYILVKAHTL